MALGVTGAERIESLFRSKMAKIERAMDHVAYKVLLTL